MKQEHINSRGRLEVPVFGSSLHPAPERQGWVPVWVSVNLSGWQDWTDAPVKIVHYKRVTS